MKPLGARRAWRWRGAGGRRVGRARRAHPELAYILPVDLGVRCGIESGCLRIFQKGILSLHDTAAVVQKDLAKLLFSSMRSGST